MCLFIMLQDLVEHCRFSHVALEGHDVLRAFIVHLFREAAHGLSWLLTVAVMRPLLMFLGDLFLQSAFLPK